LILVVVTTYGEKLPVPVLTGRNVGTVLSNCLYDRAFQAAQRFDIVPDYAHSDHIHSAD
jgi:hypothetical protein